LAENHLEDGDSKIFPDWQKLMAKQKEGGGTWNPGNDKRPYGKEKLCEKADVRGATRNCPRG